MTVLCFDISTRGVSGALFTTDLELIKIIKQRWELTVDSAGAATLTLETVLEQFREVVRRLNIVPPMEAVCIGSFLHSCVLLDEGDRPLTPVFTWLDQRGGNGMEIVRQRLGADFHQRTGCRFHPTFPIFKLASLYLDTPQLIAQTARVASIKSVLAHRLTHSWAEDHGMASASGLYNIREGIWDEMLLDFAGLKPECLPPVFSRVYVVGRVTHDGAKDLGISEGTPVINGSGDGFLANIGSD